ncbi:unnamed protein product [Protopolystoma xenopodis]|uniref:Uncharacterized protein n=1 Tax=Protopolystoma xenopodis TaxID=117903 RepID=A0A3S5BDQ6_9PLAT|nr:unnamed protein product [Protopolystoma xenopodis]
MENAIFQHNLPSPKRLWQALEGCSRTPIWNTCYAGAGPVWVGMGATPEARFLGTDSRTSVFGSGSWSSSRLVPSSKSERPTSPLADNFSGTCTCLYSGSLCPRLSLHPQLAEETLVQRLSAQLSSVCSRTSRLGRSDCEADWSECGLCMPLGVRLRGRWPASNCLHEYDRAAVTSGLVDWGNKTAPCEE